MGKHTIGEVPSFLNVSVNGQQISSHFSPNFQSVQVTSYKPNRESSPPIPSKNINLKPYIYKKYISNAISSESNKEYDLNPQMEKLVRLRKIFNDKARHKSCCEAEEWEMGPK